MKRSPVLTRYERCVSIRVLPGTHWRRDGQRSAFPQVSALSSAVQVECREKQHSGKRLGSSSADPQECSNQASYSRQFLQIRKTGQEFFVGIVGQKADRLDRRLLLTQRIEVWSLQSVYGGF